MYRLEEIVESFRTLVGWEQGRPLDLRIDEDLTRTDSGMYFNEAHPQLTLRALKGIMPDDWEEQYPVHETVSTFAKGDIVRSNGKAYISLRDENKGYMPNEVLWWKEYNLLSDYLRTLTDAGIKQVINRFIRDKVIGMETKNIIDRRCLFDGAGNINARIENTGRLCGFEITPLRSDGITTILEKVGLQFVGNTGEVTLYLFHSSCREPIAKQTFDYTKGNGTFQWFDLKDFVLPYVSAKTAPGGTWYVVYNQKDLPPFMESINFARDWSREPCGSCNKGDVVLYRTMSQYMQLSPFCVDVQNWDGMLWDVEDNTYTNTLNYGLNFQFSTGCDITDILIAERLSFATAIQLQVANKALRTIALNPEVSVNRVQANADRNNLLYELDGNGMAVKGLHGDLEKAYKALSFSTKGLAPICLSCHTKGIRFQTI